MFFGLTKGWYDEEIPDDLIKSMERELLLKVWEKGFYLKAIDRKDYPSCSGIGINIHLFALGHKRK